MYIFTENVENFGSESHFAVDYVILNMLAGNTGPCNLQWVLEHCSSFNLFLFDCVWCTLQSNRTNFHTMF